MTSCCHRTRRCLYLIVVSLFAPTTSLSSIAAAIGRRRSHQTRRCHHILSRHPSLRRLYRRSSSRHRHRCHRHRATLSSLVAIVIVVLSRADTIWYSRVSFVRLERRWQHCESSGARPRFVRVCPARPADGQSGSVWLVTTKCNGARAWWGGGRRGLGLELLYRVDGVLLATEEKGRGNVLIPTVPLLTPINGKKWSSPIFWYW